MSQEQKKPGFLQFYVEKIASPFWEFFSSGGNNKALKIFVLLVIAAAIPLTFLFSQQRQEIRQHAQDHEECVAEACGTPSAEYQNYCQSVKDELVTDCLQQYDDTYQQCQTDFVDNCQEDEQTCNTQWVECVTGAANDKYTCEQTNIDTCMDRWIGSRFYSDCVSDISHCPANTPTPPQSNTPTPTNSQNPTATPIVGLPSVRAPSSWTCNAQNLPCPSGGSATIVPNFTAGHVDIYYFGPFDLADNPNNTTFYNFTNPPQVPRVNTQVTISGQPVTWTLPTVAAGVVKKFYYAINAHSQVGNEGLDWGTQNSGDRGCAWDGFVYTGPSPLTKTTTQCSNIPPTLMAFYVGGTGTITPSPTSIVGASPTPIPPTAVPTICIGNVCTTPVPTTPVTPSPTVNPLATQLAFTLRLQGVGNASLQENLNPRTTARNIDVEILNTAGTVVNTATGTISYNSSSGLFTGTVNLNVPLNGDYNVRVKSNRYLKKIIPGIQRLASSQTITMPQATLDVGDITGDNIINILDHNILRACGYGAISPRAMTDSNSLFNSNECKAFANRSLSDLDDNGTIDGTDYNLFIRSLIVHSGD